jgi:aminoglycoside 6'-N-acetyltransferase I
MTEHREEIAMVVTSGIDDERSQRAHEALGFEVVDRCVHFRKRV